MRTITFAALAGLGAVVAAPVSAEPSDVTLEQAYEAGETIIDLSYVLSDFLYDNSYFVVSIRPDETCTLTKRLEDYSPEDELTKVTVTTYDAALIDPARIEPNGYGAINFWARDEAKVFHQEVIEGGDFSADLPGDMVTVNEEADIDPLIDALKTFATWCDENGSFPEG
ncbi:hypothetical protein [Henriciella litoralis]|uniref:hypothetical protein n=1 Tax=Henriciella litoralis TaxID=568102 RepID=UPI000A01AB48|nr:hypothetical protein [Henriciella litoralis]